MRNSAHRYSSRIKNESGTEIDKCDAITHKYARYKGPTYDEVMPKVGIIRFHRKSLGSEIISHESTHMAWWIYSLDHEFAYGSPSASIDSEEVLCYLVGDITRKIVNKLYKLGYYGEN